MEEYNISLVVFTWFTQAALGIIIIRAVYTRLAINNYNKPRAPAHFMLLLAMILAITGLLFSFTHLHYPQHSLNAINNLKDSWMSREILAEMFFISLTILLYIAHRYKIKMPVQRILELASIISGLILLYFMIRTYMLPAIPELNHPALPVSFIITPLISGSVIAAFFIRNHLPSLAVKFKILASVVFLAALINFLIFTLSNDNLSFASLFTNIHFATFFAFIPSFYSSLKNKNGISDVIFLNLAIICDFLNRIYILSFTYPGL